MDKRNKILEFIFFVGKKIAPQPVTDYCKIKYYTYKANKSTLEYNKVLRKDSYINVYKKYIDKKAYKFDINDKTISSGKFDLNLLQKLGLKKNNTLFEFGVGYLRSSKHFVEYLNSEKFYGNDASSERIKRGEELFPIIKKKKATLITSKDNTLSWLKGKKFDFIYSYAVFCHMPVDDIKETFKNIYKKAMHKESKFIFSYSELDFNNYSEQQNNVQRRNQYLNQQSAQQNTNRYNGNDFQDTFNRVYDDHKISNPFDNGYGDMMLQPTQRGNDKHVSLQWNNLLPSFVVRLTNTNCHNSKCYC